MKQYQKIYEVFILVIALLAVILVALDLSNNIPVQYLAIYRVVDISIWLIFVVDYIVRFALSKEKWKFVKGNIFDLLAIIPFDSIFRAFRIVRVFRILKIFRSALYLSRLLERIKPFLHTNGLIYVIWITVLMTLISGGIISYIEPSISSFQDGVWWAFVTVTTVGYGDMAPASGLGRLIAGILMLVGIGFIGMLTGTIATYFLSIFNHNKSIVTEENNILKDLTDEQREMALSYIEYLGSKNVDNGGGKNE